MAYTILHILAPKPTKIHKIGANQGVKKTKITKTMDFCHIIHEYTKMHGFKCHWSILILVNTSSHIQYKVFWPQNTPKKSKNCGNQGVKCQFLGKNGQNLNFWQPFWAKKWKFPKSLHIYFVENYFVSHLTIFQHPKSSKYREELFWSPSQMKIFTNPMHFAI